MSEFEAAKLEEKIESYALDEQKDNFTKKNQNFHKNTIRLSAKARAWDYLTNWSNGLFTIYLIIDTFFFEPKSDNLDFQNVIKIFHYTIFASQ